MNSKFIVIDGLDGSGKSTQLELLKNAFKDAFFLSFPYYDTPSGQIISEYLSDGFHENNKEISAYTASSFYAVDRYTSFKNYWEKEYFSKELIISARYVSSNAIYQMTKLEKSKWDDFLYWIEDFEYNKFGLPKPDTIIFLDMPTEISQKMLEKRYNGDCSKKDIHEGNINFLNTCREAALYVAEKQNWQVIKCYKDKNAISIEEINNKIVDIIKGTINA